MQKRKDGRYQSQVFIGYDENGKRKCISVYGKTQKECKLNADKLRIEKEQGSNLKLLTSPLETWVKLFLTQEKGVQSKVLYETKEYRLNWWVNFLGKDNKLNKITTVDVNAGLNELCRCNPRTGNKTSVKTLKEYKNCLEQVYKFAIDSGVGVVNPVKSVKLPKGQPKQERRALTEEERQNICNLPTSPEKTMAMLGLYAGLRRGEIAALTWDDIDFKKECIKVSKSWDFNEKKIKGTKTKAGYRLVPLFAPLKTYLSTLNKQVLISEDVRSYWYWDKSLASLLLQLDGNTDAPKEKFGDRYVVYITIQGFTWHELRHTFCTMLYEKDCPVQEAAKIMGHDDVSTTMNIYTHLLVAKENDTWNKLKDSFKSNSSQQSADAV